MRATVNDKYIKGLKITSSNPDKVIEMVVTNKIQSNGSRPHDINQVFKQQFLKSIWRSPKNLYA